MTPRILIILTIISTPLFSKGQDLVIANTKMNILYVGVHNPIQFASKIIPIKELRLVPQRGEIINTNGQFVYVSCKNQPGELVIYAQNKKTNKIIDSVIFRLKYLPEPTIRITADNMMEGGYVGSNILKDIIGVIAYSLDDFELPIEIVSFRVTITSSTGINKSFTNDGNRISPEIKNEIYKSTDITAAVIHDVRIRMGCVTEPRLLNQKVKLK